MESAISRNPQLAYEAKAYYYLREGVAVPRIYYFGTEDTYNVMVMDLLGPQSGRIAPLPIRQVFTENCLYVGSGNASTTGIYAFSIVPPSRYQT